MGEAWIQADAIFDSLSADDQEVLCSALITLERILKPKSLPRDASKAKVMVLGRLKQAGGKLRT